MWGRGGRDRGSKGGQPAHLLQQSENVPYFFFIKLCFPELPSPAIQRGEKM